MIFIWKSELINNIERCQLSQIDQRNCKKKKKLDHW